MGSHEFTVGTSWHGSTAGGYQDYSRDHVGRTTPATVELPLSAAPAFLGSADRLDPEQLLILSASSCQTLSLLALAARRGIDILAVEDAAWGEMDKRDQPLRVSSIVLRPTITVAPGTDLDLVRDLVHLAHEECFIARTLATEVQVEPTIVRADRRS